MLKGARGRRGFTLIETVVTVGIVATLAAVVVPQVVKQFDAADPARIQNDLKNIQTAIETFSVNVKAAPGDLDDLANLLVVTGGVDSTLGTGTTAAAFAGTENTLWNGPYLDASVVQSDPDDDITTGYAAKIADNFVCYDSGDNSHGISEATGTGALNDVACPVATDVGQKFLAIQITGIACSTSAGSTFMKLNEAFDGAGEASAATSGRVRCELASATSTKDTDVDVVFFLAVPLG